MNIQNRGNLSNYPPYVKGSINFGSKNPLQQKPLETPEQRLLTIPSGVYIKSQGGIGKGQFLNYIVAANRKNWKLTDQKLVIRIIDAYFKYSKYDVLGINSDLAIAQAILETGFFNFKGDVNARQYNFAGIGATGGGAKGESFSSPEHGVVAHLLHLNAYCGFRPPEKLKHWMAPRTELLFEAGLTSYEEPRAPNRKIEDLGSRWATDKKYSEKIKEVIESASEYPDTFDPNITFI